MMLNRKLISRAEEVFASAKQSSDNMHAREVEVRGDAKTARLKAERLARDAAIEGAAQKPDPGKPQP